jgi:MoxR-like ATPase
VDAAGIRAAAEDAGLRLPAGVYANVAAALGTGRHLILTGAPGAGKTTLALAVSRAAAQAGRTRGATLMAVTPDSDHAPLVDAARRGRWLVLDELDRVDPEQALGPLSAFLAGLPAALPDGEEIAAPPDWRIVATWGGAPPAARVLRRFAVVEVGRPPADTLRAAIEAAANGDPTAAAAAQRLADGSALGAGVFLDAARHAAARNAAAPTDEATLARELYAAYVAPLAEPGDG